MTKKVDTEILVFDKGNTLLMDPFYELLSLRKENFTAILTFYGLVVNVEKFFEQWEESNKKVNYPFISHFGQEEPIIQHALRSLDIGSITASILGVELLKEYRLGLIDLIRNDPRTKEVRETLEELRLRGKRLGILSNDRILELDLELETMGIKNLFEYIETSESLGIEKPSLGVFNHMIDHFKVNPSEIVYIGDDPIRDIDAPKDFGLRTILYKVDTQKYNMDWRKYDIKTRHQPDAVINHFYELLDVVN